MMVESGAHIRLPVQIQEDCPAEKVFLEAELICRTSLGTKILEVYLFPMRENFLSMQTYLKQKPALLHIFQGTEGFKLYLKREVIYISGMPRWSLENLFQKLLTKKDSWLRHWCM